QGEPAQAPGECLLAVVVELLIPQEDHLVLEQRLPDDADDLGGRACGSVHADDLGADVASQPADGDPGRGREQVGHGGSLFRVVAISLKKPSPDIAMQGNIWAGPQPGPPRSWTAPPPVTAFPPPPPASASWLSTSRAPRR